ncbi:hypothetical protein M569_02509 [Genlisea aurea]|uniref:spermidine synthase n=1 Tax=Genlisea aurea TaxID=192259 RepID=S8CZ18_9LAMI|nr:hypothetical protein M569_02509 [Genlisea aurea]
MRTVIIGLGAGLLPMFIKNGLPNMDIQVVELDPVVLDVARQYFGFTEDESLTAHVTDGIKFVSNIAAEERDMRKVDVLIVDVDSSDLSHGLTCPAAEFVEEPFLSSARDSLSENGLLIVNLVTRSLAVKNCVRWRLKKVFGKKVFHLQVEEDVNEVVFAVKKEDSSACSFDEDWLREGRSKLLAQGGGKQRRWFQRIIEASQSITPYD